MIAALKVAAVGASAFGAYTSYQGAKQAESAQRYQQRIAEQNARVAQGNVGVFEKVADNEKAITAQRVREEQRRASQNLLRQQEEKRKRLSRTRAQFVANGVLADSPSANFLIGELGENLQTNIQDIFVESSGRVAAIQAQGNRRYFDNLQKGYAAKVESYEAANRARAAGFDTLAASRQRTASLISGIGNVASATYSAFGS